MLAEKFPHNQGPKILKKILRLRPKADWRPDKRTRRENLASLVQFVLPVTEEPESTSGPSTV